MEDYKPNSHKSKASGGDAEKKKVEKVISGKAELKQKTGARKFADALASVGGSDTKTNIFVDTLIAAGKRFLGDIVKDSVDIVKNAIDMTLFGEFQRGSSGGIRGDYVSYGSRYDNRTGGQSRRSGSESRGINKPEYVTVDSMGDAKYVIEQMDALIEEYKVVSVADLYDLVGIEHNYTDNKYGWTNIRNARPVRLRDGRYAIDLPKALPLD